MASRTIEGFFNDSYDHLIACWINFGWYYIRDNLAQTIRKASRRLLLDSSTYTQNQRAQNARFFSMIAEVFRETKDVDVPEVQTYLQLDRKLKRLYDNLG
jgi:hypothetical protein